MPDISPSVLPLVVLWLAAALLAAVATAGSLCLAALRRATPAWWTGFVRVVLVTVMALAIADTEMRPPSSAATGAPWIVFRMALGIVGILLAASIVRLPSPTIHGGWPGIVGGGVAAVLACARLQAIAAPSTQLLPPTAASLIQHQPDDTAAHAVTDRGSIIQLRCFTTIEHEPLVPDGFNGRVIVATAEQSPSNCHGWVFTGGRFQIAGADVATILEDNGYSAVTAPRPDDLIVYRNPSGAIIHTGLVKAVGTDGFVLVESKWGPLDIYWHTPYEQTYSQRFEYWRSRRDGHGLTVVTPAGDAARP